MKQNKKWGLLALSALLIFALLFSGCAKKDPVERLEMAFQRSAKMETATQTLDLEMFFDTAEESPQFAMMKNILNGMKITGKIDVDQKAMDFAGKIKMEFQGMSYEMELYKGKEYFLKIPMVNQYIVIMDEVQTAEFFNKDMLNSLNGDMMQVILSRLNSSNTTVRQDLEITQEGKKTKVTPIAITISDEEAKDIFAELMKFVFENPEMQAQMKENMKLQMKAAGTTLSDEELDVMAAESATQMDQAMEMMRRAISIEKMEAVYYLDNNNDIRKTDMDYTLRFDLGAMAVQEPSAPGASPSSATPAPGADAVGAGPSFTLRFAGSSDVLNINQPINLEIPELTPENSIGMEGLASLPF